jgi:hypothetical protein
MGEGIAIERPVDEGVEVPCEQASTSHATSTLDVDEGVDAPFEVPTSAMRYASDSIRDLVDPRRRRGRRRPVRGADERHALCERFHP